MGLADGEDRELRLSDLAEALTLSRRGDHCSGTPIDAALRALHAREGDLLFLRVRGSEARLILRRRRELSDGNPLSELLWSCGLDPTDEPLRREPWPRLGRALGGSTDGRDEVRHRLIVRGDERLLALLENSKAVRLAVSDDSWWPYTGWLVQDARPAVVLDGEDGRRRVLLGVLDASNRPPRELTLTDGGLLWVETPTVGAEVSSLLSAPPEGLIPSGRRAGWCRWLRTEHILRLRALCDTEWWVERTTDGWNTQKGVVYGALLDVLDLAFEEATGEPRPPASRISRPYPRTAGAFRALAEDAVKRGLRALRADPDSGFRAVYGDDELSAASLHECLMP
jgi:hypothetical protein